MALLWADGFDHYGTVGNMALGSYSLSSIVLVSDPSKVRTGGYAIDATGAGNYTINLTRAITSSGPIIGAGFGLLATNAPGYANSFFYYFVKDTNGVVIISACFNSQNGIDIRRGNNGAEVILSTPNNVIVPGAYSYVELKYQLDDLAGYVTVVVNNAVIASTSNINTIGDGSNGVPGSVGFQKDGGASTAWPSWYVDDFVVWDGSGAQNNDFFGDIRCRTILPESDGANQAWLPVGQDDAFACVNQVPPQPGVDYIQAANPGDVSSFNLQAVPLNTGTIHGVMLHVNLNKADAGVCGVTTGIGSGGGAIVSNVINPGTGPAYYSKAFDVDPQGNPWTVGTVNASNALVERVQ